MTTHSRPNPVKEKRPAEAGRQAGNAIPSGAARMDSSKTSSAQEKNKAGLPASNRVIAYIDGFNLYFGMKSKGWRRYYWLDLVALCQSLLKPDQTLVATNYFTSRVSPTPHDPKQVQRQNTYLEALEASTGLLPILGHYLPKTMTCRQCSNTWQTFEEKRTDVNIAIEMLADAHADRFDTALLISADSDLSAPIEKTRLLFPGKRVIAAFPPGRHSSQLARLVHGSFTIGEAKLRQNQHPESITKADGFVLQRPKRWL
jgi:uncharacterized LabA/DUF88 family protein